MLVIERKESQRIVIDGGISITVCRISGGKVRIGVSAPTEVAIHREEVHRKIESEKSDTSAEMNESVTSD